MWARNSRQREPVGSDAIAHHQQPLGEALLDLVQAVADEILRELVEEEAGEPEELIAKGLVHPRLLPEPGVLDACEAARNLNDRLAAGGRRSGKQCLNDEHPFRADDAGFDRQSAFGRAHDGHHGTGKRKEDGVGCFVGAHQDRRQPVVLVVDVERGERVGCEGVEEKVPPGSACHR
jgi:hypothetical protein